MSDFGAAVSAFSLQMVPCIQAPFFDSVVKMQLPQHTTANIPLTPTANFKTKQLIKRLDSLF